jgi:hypothetical protein
MQPLTSSFSKPVPGLWPPGRAFQKVDGDALTGSAPSRTGVIVHWSAS